jgi:hypothetical protein
MYKRLELYKKNRRRFVTWIVASVVMAFVGLDTIKSQTPNIEFNSGVISILVFCWIIISALLYKVLKDQKDS